MAKIETYRTFVAIDVPGSIRAHVNDHINRLRRELPDVRASWGPEDNLHLTLKFLGNVPLADIPKVSNAVEQASKTISPFDLVLSGCGSFPPHGRPKVLWIGVSSAVPESANSNPQFAIGSSPHPAPYTLHPGLATLHSSLEHELAAAGFPRATRPFHPHLTIARLRNPQGARSLGELHKSLGFTAGAFTVSELVVYRSELLKEGSKHPATSRHELR